MPKATKRERQRQNRDARRAAMEEAEKRKKRNRTIRNLVLLLIPLVIIFVILQLTKSDDSDKKSSSASNVACGAKAPTGKPTTTTLAAAPPMTIDPAKDYTAVMKTSCGDVTIALDADTAPETVNSFVTLARSGFYDDTRFHRIVPDFVDQGGDPTGTGSGTPGFSLPDEPPADGYQAGSVAMANAGTGTTGSQFFLVVSDSGAQQLGTTPPYKYSSLGTMDAAGLKVAKKINSFGGSDEKPTKNVYVYSVDISESDTTTTTAAP